MRNLITVDLIFSIGSGCVFYCPFVFHIVGSHLFDENQASPSSKLDASTPFRLSRKRKTTSAFKFWARWIERWIGPLKLWLVSSKLARSTPSDVLSTPCLFWALPCWRGEQTRLTRGNGRNDWGIRLRENSQVIAVFAEESVGEDSEQGSVISTSCSAFVSCFY